MLYVKRHVFEKMAQRCVDGYPFETAGLMIGVGSARTVLDHFPVQNVDEHDRRVRYRVNPIEYLRAEQYAEEKGLEVIGVYHSHPEVAARPSRHDLEYALPTWSYLIFSVTSGKILGYASWVLVENGEGRRFVEEKVVVE